MELLTCKICGHTAGKTLQTHINRFHSLRIQDYLEKFPGVPVFTEAVREASRISNRTRDQSYRIKLSENTKRLYQDPEWAEKHNAALRKAQGTEEAKQNHSVGAIRYFTNQTSEQKTKQKEACKESWANPTTRENRVTGLRKAHRSEIGRQNHSKATKDYYAGLSVKEREDIRKNLRETWAKPELRGKIIELSKIGLEKAMSPEGRANFYNYLRNNPRTSYLNTMMKKALEEIGLFPEPEEFVGPFQVDFLFRGEKLVVETDGDFWHANPLRYPDRKKLYPVQVIRVKRDTWENSYCKKHDYTILRFWETDMNNDITSCVTKIQEILAVLQKDTLPQVSQL